MTVGLKSGLSALALAVGLAGAVGSAQAEQRFLFDMLFGNNVQRERPAETIPQQRQQQQARTAPLPKISSPSFYNYRPQSLAMVDFEALVASLDNAEGSSFKAALSELGKSQLYVEEDIAEALIAYYSENPEFIWFGEDGYNDRAKAILAVLSRADEFGLNVADYAIGLPSPETTASIESGDAGDAGEGLKVAKVQLRREMMLSARALRYARDAHIGRVDPNKLSGYHDLPKKSLDEKRVLSALANSPKPAAYLESLHPRNELYSRLVKELKTLKASAEKEIVVDPDTFVRPGGGDPDFAKILQIIDRDANDAFRAEHGELLKAHAGSETYVRELEPVIKAAQRSHDLNPDGIVGPRTVGALAGESKQARIEKVTLALERLRWHPSRLGSTRVMVNAASFTASYIEDGLEILDMRAVVGTRANQTSFFYDEIEYVEFNPYWGVPRSIIVNEMLPKLRRDPSYLDRQGYEVTTSSGRRVSSSAVNWAQYGANIPINVRQPPGPRNALGELKIMFPNKHSIYMHDTPAKNLFSRDTRAYSHGCVRLQDPRAMAAAVLGVSREEIARSVAAGRNARTDAPKNIPVYVGYFTAWPEADGTVSFHQDVYRRDHNLAKAIAKVEAERAPAS